MAVLDVVSVVLILLGLINWFATMILVHGAWIHRWPALVERALMAVALTLSGTAIMVLAFARLDHLTLSRDLVTVLLVGGFVLASLPGPIWLIAYTVGRFDE